jgi:hypothetical protein
VGPVDKCASSPDTGLDCTQVVCMVFVPQTNVPIMNTVIFHLLCNVISHPLDGMPLLNCKVSPYHSLSTFLLHHQLTRPQNQISVSGPNLFSSLASPHKCMAYFCSHQILFQGTLSSVHSESMRKDTLSLLARDGNFTVTRKEPSEKFAT